MDKNVPLVQSEIHWNSSEVLSVAEYMEQRRKDMDRYVQGEHRWFGDTCTSMPSLSYNSNPVPWYVQHENMHSNTTAGCN